MLDKAKEQKLIAQLNWCVNRINELQREIQEVQSLALETQGALKLLRGELTMVEIERPEVTE